MCNNHPSHASREMEEKYICKYVTNYLYIYRFTCWLTNIYIYVLAYIHVYIYIYLHKKIKRYKDDVNFRIYLKQCCID